MTCARHHRTPQFNCRTTLTAIALTLVVFCPSIPSVIANEPTNVLLICVDDLRPELHCYGVDYIHSPNIDSLAASGCLFERHYVQAPTCGASRYALLTGRYGSTGNDAIFKRAEQFRKTKSFQHKSLPGWFRQNGFTTVSVGKVSHHPGGLGGSDWNDPSIEEMPGEWTRHLMPSGPWQHPRGAMHGLANGEIRVQTGDMDVMQSVAGDDSIYPDGLITQEAVAQLQQLADSSQPFLLAVGLIRPHLPFGAPAKYMEKYVDVELPAIFNPNKPRGKTTWHGSGEFMKYNRWNRDPRVDDAFAEAVRKHYAACVTYADAQVGILLNSLETLKLADNTVVVLWGDHGWHLGERSVWGKHTLFEESLHSPLIIRAPGITKPDSRSKSIVETIDILPTLCDLTELQTPDSSHGSSLKPILKSPTTSDGTAISYWGGNNKIYSLRTDQYRLVQHPSGDVELYDFESENDSSENIAAQEPDTVNKLQQLLNAKLQKSVSDGA